MIVGLISFIIGCSIILGITILTTKMWYRTLDKKNPLVISTILANKKTINYDEWIKKVKGISKQQQRRADVIHEYINKQIYLNKN